jgi:hypothetical protein
VCVAGSSRWEFELRSIFEAFDLEGTGTVNKKELREIMRRLGITDLLYLLLTCFTSCTVNKKELREIMRRLGITDLLY